MLNWNSGTRVRGCLSLYEEAAESRDCLSIELAYAFFIILLEMILSLFGGEIGVTTGIELSGGQL